MPTSVHVKLLGRLDELKALENPLRHKDVRDLEGEFKEYYRLRVGEYRIVFELDPAGRRIGVHAIAPRGQAY